MLGNTTMQVRQTDDGRTELELAGEVTVFCATQLHEEALRLSDRGVDVLICAEHLTGVDASTLQVLVALKAALARQGRQLQFQGLTSEILETLRMADLDVCLRGSLQAPRTAESVAMELAT